MEEKKMLFIYNPHAGKASIRSNLLDIIDIFTKAGYEVTAQPTQKKGDAISATINKAGRYDILVCSGGDGTIDEVVTGMMQRNERIPIGYVPAGTTNDFARSLKIPRTMMKAAQAIVDGRAFGCDIGSFNGDAFVYIAAFGLFTDVSYLTDQNMKNVLGHMAYLLEGAKRLNSYPSYHMKFEANGTVIEDDFMYGMITNSVSVGGFKNITGRNVKLDDGVFEVTLIKKPKTVSELNQLMTSLVMRDVDTDCMYCFKTSQITFECEDEVPWTLDGEYGGHQRKVTIQNEMQATEIIVP
jgi:YegS/Rv2252/BmrU family lipid kinase